MNSLSKQKGMAALVFAAGLCAASAAAAITPRVSFTDSWRDAAVYDTATQTYSVTTSGSFSFNLTLPLAGADLGALDANSSFWLMVDLGGNNSVMVSEVLGNAQSYSLARKTATFGVVDPGTGATNGSVTVTWMTNSVTITGSAFGDALGLELMLEGSSSGTATNFTLNTVSTGVYGEVNVGLDASDNGGGLFNYDDKFVPVTGNNRETEYYGRDGSGPYALESGSLSGAGDFTPPTVSISGPAAGFKVYDINPVINLTGRAADNNAVADVECMVNGDTNNLISVDQLNLLPTNSLNWSAAVDLSHYGALGTNVITVIAYDLSGNQAAVSRSFLWVETNAATLAVSPAGAGTIQGLRTGQILQKGSAYAVSANPANRNWIFSRWTDGTGKVLSTNPSFAYVDTDGSLTANFAPNPFNNTVLAGNYTGLFYDSVNGVDPRDAGYLALTVTPSGAFSGKITLAAASPGLAGQLVVLPDGSAAVASLPVKVSNTAFLTVNLQVAAYTNLSTPGAGLLNGSVAFYGDATQTNQIASTVLQGGLALYNTNVLAGTYNVVLAPLTVRTSVRSPQVSSGVIVPVGGGGISTNPALAPGGFSYGTLTVTRKNPVVPLTLHLADGAAATVSLSASMTPDGTCPLFTSLYGGKGVLMGWMQFALNNSGALPPNGVSWVKLPTGTKYYTNGFSASPALFGNLYVPPKTGTNVFGWTAGKLAVDAGYAGLSLPNEMDFAATFNAARNAFTVASPATLTFTPGNGAIGGTFFSPPGGRTSYSFNGVEVNGTGYGFFTGTNNQTGPIAVSAAR